MKKILFCLMLMLFIPVVKAGSFSISASSTSINVGQSVTVYVSVSDAAGKFNASSNNSGVLAFSDDANNVWIDNGSSSFKFTAKSAGKATITITPSDCAGYDEKEITSSKSITITVNAPSNNSGGSTGGGSSSNNRTTVSERAKSSINYLSSLGVEGFELSPKFDKETTEYDVTLPNGTSSIKVTGEKEDSASSVIGLGDVSVSEGVNTINVEVTAENGAKKVYVIRATVEEKAPIVVNIDGKDFTLVRKSDMMPSASDYYVLGNITIDDNEIPAYTSEVTKYTLVALKDDVGNISLYRYDNGTYTKYVEYSFSSIKISQLVPTDIPKGYSEGTVKINEVEVKAYTKEGSLPLIYGMNVETGDVNFYSYDSVEGTIQKFIIVDEKKDNSLYPFIIIGLAGLSFIEFIAIICIISSKNKRLKKEFNDKLNTRTDFEQAIDSNSKLDQSIDSNTDYEQESEVSEGTTEQLGHTALISSNVGNVFDNSKNRKESKKSKNKDNDDDMYRF